LSTPPVPPPWQDDPEQPVIGEQPEKASYREQFPAKKKPDKATWLIALVIVVGVGGCSAWVANRGSSPPSETGKRLDAGRTCENFVKDRLKAPSTADFGDRDVSGSAGTYTVTSTVDADNSFGAKLRSNYTCQVHESADGKNWVLDSLTGLDGS
jgi:hypothetical protein